MTLSPCAFGLGVVGTAEALEFVSEYEHLAGIFWNGEGFFHAVAEEGGLVLVVFRVYLQEEIDFGLRVCAVAPTEHGHHFIVREEEISRIFSFAHMPSHANT